MIKTMLVAVDGSTASFDAARVASGLATAMGAALTAAFVIVPTVMLGEIPFTIAGEIAKAERARGEAVLAEVQAALKRADVAVRLLEGGPAEEIVRVANEEDFGMVVVGSRGHNAVSRVLLGSVADRVLHTCKRPVLVVR